jgi:pyrophosphatase PpaX
MIKAVLFDIDGVLIDSFDANLKFYQDLFTAAGYPPITRVQFLQLFHATMFDVIKTVTKSPSEKEVQRIWKMGNSRAVPYPVDLMKVPRDINETIQRLSKIYRLGIVTSRVRNGVFEFPKLASLQQYFSLVVAYEDTTNHKPHPEPLLFAAKQMKITPDEIVYIGDLDNDIQAASAAGMKVIIYSKTPFDSADGYTNSFKELPNVIKRLHG